MTGLQPVSKPVEQILGFFQKVLKEIIIKCFKNGEKVNFKLCGTLLPNLWKHNWSNLA